MDEKDLRNISSNGKDLLSCLNKEESEDYYREEVKGKVVYHKDCVKYKSKAERRGKVRRWTQREITMYEELKNYKTVTELVLMLMKIDGWVSAKSGMEALKDHPLKPGMRGIAQAIQRVYERLEPAMQKNRKGREVHYFFAHEDLRKVDLSDLYSLYLRKETLQHLMERLNIFKSFKKEIPESELTVVEKYDRMIESLGRTEEMLEVLKQQNQRICSLLHSLWKGGYVKRLKEKIDVAIANRKQLKKELADKDAQITKLLAQQEFLTQQAAKVEGLIDENVKQANQIEELLGELSQLTRRISEELIG